MIDLKTSKDIIFDGNHIKKIESPGLGVIWQKENPRYITIDSIKSNGGQWLATSLSSTGDYIIECEFKIDTISTPGGDGNWIIGARINPPNGVGVFMGASGLFNAWNSLTRSFSSNFTAGDWVYLYFSRTKMYTINRRNGDKRDYTVTGGTLVPEEYGTDILIGKNLINYSGTGDDPRNLYGSIKYVKITDAPTLTPLLEYVPRIDSVDNRVGMLDLVNNTFNTSAGYTEYTANTVANGISLLNSIGIEASGNHINNENLLKEIGVIL